MAEGHRDRLAKRFETEDIDDIPEYVVLEMMLTAAVRRRDTCSIARELIERFGTLAQVIDAPAKELLKVPGMGKAMVTHIKLIPKYFRKYRLSKWEKLLVIKNLDHAADYLMDKFIGRESEEVFMMCMDLGGKVLAVKSIFKGSINAVHVSVREIVDIALQYKSARVVIAHNHLSGNAFPSDADLETTKTLQKALEMVGIKLDDHVIVADEDYVSLKKSGYVSGL